MLTVSQLRKAIKGAKGSTPVYWADHDHGTFETNSCAGQACIMNQDNADDYERKYLKEHPEFKIKGDYLLIRP